MFLGWVFNVLYIVFAHNYIPAGDQKFLKVLFCFLQCLLIAMTISFPLQGYGLFSIIFSSLHTLGAIVFVIVFLRKTRDQKSVSRWYARVALIFFVLSAGGPFALGYIAANGMGHSNAYYFSIYFYLHFQYNGFFLFGVFSLLLRLLEQKGITFDRRKAKTIGSILALTCVPTYLLNILWAKPGYVFNITGGLAAFAQFAALILMLKAVHTYNAIGIRRHFRSTSIGLFHIALIAFGLKLCLQFISSFPAVARMALELRPVVIAYLHLVLLGIISLALLIWYLESDLLGSGARRIIVIFLTAFVGMEICMVMMPWWRSFFGPDFLSASVCLLFFSAVLSVSCLLLFLSSLRQKTDKNQAFG
jgi:hypothetical protein